MHSTAHTPDRPLARIFIIGITFRVMLFHNECSLLMLNSNAICTQLNEFDVGLGVSCSLRELIKSFEIFRFREICARIEYILYHVFDFGRCI